MGIRDKPIAPASPWQNGVFERLIGSIRRECVDHIIVLGEAHLRRILKSYADALGLGQGCARFSPGSANRCGQLTCHPRRTSSPLRPSLSFWYTQGVPVLLQFSLCTCRRHYPGGTAGCLSLSSPAVAAFPL